MAPFVLVVWSRLPLRKVFAVTLSVLFLLGACTSLTQNVGPVATAADGESVAAEESSLGPFASESRPGDVFYYYTLGQLSLRERRWQEAERAFMRVAQEDPASVEALLIVSHLATQRGDLDRAIEFAEKVVKIEPDHQKSRVLLAGLLTAQSRFVAAAEQYEALLKIAPNHPAARLLLAQIYGQLKKPESARATLALLFKQPDSAWKAHLAMGRALVNVPDLDGSLLEFRAALRLAPSQLEPVLALGAALQELKRPKEAEKVYRTFLALHPESEAVHGRLGRLLLNQNNKTGALAEFRAITDLAPDSVQARLTAGLILLSERQFTQALAELRLAEASQPTSSTVQFYLGQALEASNRENDAVTSYQKIKKGASFYVEAQLRLALIEATKGAVDKAIQHVQQLVIDAPERVDLLDALSIIQFQAKDYAGAEATCTRGLKIDPEHGRLRFNRAMALDKLLRWPESEADLRLYIARHPDDAHALNYLGYTLAERNEKLSESHKLLEKAFLLAPGDGFISDSLGWVLFRLNRLDEALSRMREAVHLEPNDPTIREHLGDVLHALGKESEAMEVWKKALSLDKSNQKLKSKIGQHASVP